MNKDDIIELAKQAGMTSLNYGGIPLSTQIIRCSLYDLKRFAQYISLHEIDECAKIASKNRFNTMYLASNPPQSAAAYDIERDIKKRKLFDNTDF